VSGLLMRRSMAAGHNAFRGSGPCHKHAFRDALAQVGCPDPRINRHSHYLAVALSNWLAR